MQKDAILAASRKENANKDLAELAIMRSAGNYASTVGAIACSLILLLGSILADIMLYSPWFIYFSMMGAIWFVRAVKLKQKSDWIAAIMFTVLSLLALTGFVIRLIEVVS